ncbi:hypothetical protein GCM10008908_01450 [Clostridium subterminale]|uniref:Uncharacterized protein n=1 Tax=Clostridium subterminale TaxID=1550 RepID=A0ABN1KFD5_CLOSU
MKSKLNFYSFILSLICIMLFFLSISSNKVINFTMDLLHVHPIFIVMILSIVTLIIGILGLSTSNNLILLFRGLFSVVISIIMTGFIFFILTVSILVGFV